MSNTIKRYIRRREDGVPKGLWNFLLLTKYNILNRKKWDVKRETTIRKYYNKKTKTFNSADEAFEWLKTI